MSYKTRVNDVQVFGNNEYYQEWLDFIRAQGIKIGEEGDYDGYITDFTGAVRTCEKIVLRLESEREETRSKLVRTAKDPMAAKDSPLVAQFTSLFDLSDIKRTLDGQDPDCPVRLTLSGELIQRIKYGYLFIPVMFIAACKDDIELDPTSSCIWDYKLKPGARIHVHAG